MTKLQKVNSKARRLGISEKIEISSRKSKKFMVRYKGKLIHFGSSDHEDFLDHKDKKRRNSYLKRAKGIRDGNGNLTYRKKSKANYWAINLLW